MLPDLTEAVLRALQSAQRAADAEVRPLDLLRALLEEDEGRPVYLLRAAGVALSALTAQGDSSQQNQLPARLSAEAERIFDEAASLARALTTDRHVATDTLLLALVRHAEEVRRLLDEHGLRFVELESAVLGDSVVPLELEQPLSLLEMTERVDAARVLDAAANRAREALRVLEDYSRFCLDDAFLSSRLKQLRHDLRDVLEQLPDELPQARETLRDVGTVVSTASEGQRRSLREVVLAAAKRLQEALRSLEEFGKLLGGDIGKRIEQLRYSSYTLERALLLGATARERLRDCTIQVLVTGSLCSAALDWTIGEAAAGGAHLIQLREKTLSDRELLERARNVRRWTQRAGLLFVVNDRPDLARLVEADGVHLGQDDMPVKEARRIVGPEMLIGVSTHNLDQVRQAVLDGASYLGVGPTFASTTKAFSELSGLEFVRQATAETTLPVFAIGGINAANLAQACAAGARRIAVSAAVCQADEPRQAVAALAAILKASPVP